jgi:transglutaminase-like putative cysteine protease
MQFRISHTTRYTYAKPVSLGPHVIRLHPRADANLLLQAYHCTIEPEPRVRSYCLDQAGNVILRAEFVTPTQQLLIVSDFEATTIENAHDLSALPAELPVHYSQEEAAYLAVYRQGAVTDPSALALLGEIRETSQSQAIQFLDALNTYLYKHIAREIRDRGTPQTPQQTLTRQRGACRDITVLFMALCRAQGFAARFVSGYQAKADIEHDKRYMHAWPEVFVPGVGWCGYDPTHATRVKDAHVALAASHVPAGAAPVEGSYYGEAVESALTFNLSIDVS